MRVMLGGRDLCVEQCGMGMEAEMWADRPVIDGGPFNVGLDHKTSAYNSGRYLPGSDPY